MTCICVWAARLTAPEPQEPPWTALVESSLELWAPLYVSGLPGSVCQFPSALQWAELYSDSFLVHLRRMRASSQVCGRKLLADLWSSLCLSCVMMVLWAGVKGTASLELWTGQLSCSEKVLSPHRVSIKLSYLGSKTMVYEKGQSKQGYFSLALRKGPQRGLSYPLPPCGPGKSCREQSARGQGGSSCRSRQPGSPCRCLPAVWPDFLVSMLTVWFALCSLSYSTSPLYFLFSFSLSLRCPSSFQGFFLSTVFHVCPPQKNHWINNCFKKKFALLRFFFSISCLSSLFLTPGFSEWIICNSEFALYLRLRRLALEKL